MNKYDEKERWNRGNKTARFYEERIQRAKEQPQKIVELMKVIRPEDMPWENSRHGKLKHMVNDEMDAVSRTMTAYIQEIPPGSRTGRHRHMAEEMVFVLAGKGYDLHWDVDMKLTDRYEWVVDQEPKKFEWEAGDLIAIPVNTVHQHFNSDPEKPARILSAVNNVYKMLDCDDLEQIENAPGFKEK